MKKVIFACDGYHFSEGALEFAFRLNEISQILLTGVFLPQAELVNLWSYADGMPGVTVPVVPPPGTAAREENIERFTKRCQDNGVDYRVHRQYSDLLMPELKKETIYADLLLLGTESFYENMDSSFSGDYLQGILHELSCPVILVPEKSDFPESIVLAYDGSPNSVYAIKQFAYLFPELSTEEAVLVYANDDEHSDFPDKVEIEELASRHFPNLELNRLEIDPGKYFGTWLAEKKSALLVSGAYGRSGLSQLFRKSFIRQVIADHRLPVFIAHM